MQHSTFKIYETYLDSFGHVNNAKYLELYEQARWDWLENAGYGVDFIQEHGIGPVILNVKLNFRRELLARETITITTETLSYRKKIFVLKQQMLKSDGECASDLTLTGGLMDLRARKLINPVPAWLKAFDVQWESDAEGIQKV